MQVCTFFGHRDCPESVKPVLYETVRDLIIHENVDHFYVGNHGRFDVYVHQTLPRLKKEYPHISYAVVLAYLPRQGADGDFSDTLFPEGIEGIPKRFAIAWRNQWMLAHADYVITYVTRSWSGAAKYTDIAQRKGKRVIPITNTSPR